MKTIYDILAHFLEKSITDKGAQFERLIPKVLLRCIVMEDLSFSFGFH